MSGTENGGRSVRHGQQFSRFPLRFLTPPVIASGGRHLGVSREALDDAKVHPAL